MADSDVSHAMVGAGVGLGFGGPLGALVGGIAGLLVSQLLEDSGAPPTPANINRAQEALGSSPELLSSTMARLNEMRGTGTTKDMFAGMFENDESGALEPGTVPEGSPVSTRSTPVSTQSVTAPAPAPVSTQSTLPPTQTSSVPASASRSSVPVPAQASSAETSWTPAAIYRRLMEAVSGGEASGISDPVNAATDNPDLVAAGIPAPWSNAVKGRPAHQGVPFDQPPPGTALQRTMSGGVPADDVTISRAPSATSSGQQSLPSSRPVQQLPSPTPALPAPSPDAAPPGRGSVAPDTPPRLPGSPGSGSAVVPYDPRRAQEAMDALTMFFARKSSKKARDKRAAARASLRDRNIQRKKARESGE